jgi:hypothetical protein
MLKIIPENLLVAQTYLECQSIEETANQLDMPLAQVQEVLEKNDVKRFITNVYLDTGYRNRNKLADALDKMIAKKIDETDYGSEKDLLDLLKFAHQMRIDEEKSANNTPTTQTNVQINEFGGGNYGELMKRLLQ